MSEHTPGPWGPMNDGPFPNRKPWEPWAATMEAAPGLTIASPHNTEPICRVSGYLQPVEANARLIAAAPELLDALSIVEWNGQNEDSLCCPCCGRAKSSGHNRVCRLALALAKARPIHAPASEPAAGEAP